MQMKLTTFAHEGKNSAISIYGNGLVTPSFVIFAFRLAILFDGSADG